QPGEVRVCTSCHGINSLDQAGNTPPENTPLALAELLSWWKGGGADLLGSVDIKAITRMGNAKTRKGLRSQGRFRIRLLGGNGISSNSPLVVRFTLDGRHCGESVGPLTLGSGLKRVLKRKAPRIRGKHPLTITVTSSGFQVGILHTILRGPGKGKDNLPLKRVEKICRALSKLSYDK
ncbi:MAG: hypothetical protein KDD55_08495, partial [Bdellovibrionales bacterium]|nr:hypothetical protein [Bdellovibrionales bacterium]